MNVTKCENFKLTIGNLERTLNEYQENLEKASEGATLPPISKLKTEM